MTDFSPNSAPSNPENSDVANSNIESSDIESDDETSLLRRTLRDSASPEAMSLGASSERWIIFDPASAPATRALLREIGAAPNRTLGQNFLVNGSVLDHIVRTARLSSEDRVLEIGPGLGSLTCRLVRAAAQVAAIEKDPPLLQLLARHLPAPNLKLIGADALDVDWSALGLPESGVKVVANLPYSISKPMLRRLLEEWRAHFSSLTILVQREVADRIVAQPNTPEYGPMAIMTLLHADAKRVFDVRAGSFLPPPSVLSSVVHIEIRDTPRIALRNEKFFWAVVRAAFGQRRKQLVNTLRAVCADAEKLEIALAICQIDGKRRGETLSLQEFADLSQALSNDDFPNDDLAPGTAPNSLSADSTFEGKPNAANLDALIPTKAQMPGAKKAKSSAQNPAKTAKAKVARQREISENLAALPHSFSADVRSNDLRGSDLRSNEVGSDDL